MLTCLLMNGYNGMIMVMIEERHQPRRESAVDGWAVRGQLS